MQKERDIQVTCQRWILGRRLADDDQLTMQQYDIGPSNSSLYLYILADPPTKPKPQPQLTPENAQKPQSDTQPDQPNNTKKYYNYQEDRYSTCDEESDDEPMAIALDPDMTKTLYAPNTPDDASQAGQTNDNQGKIGYLQKCYHHLQK